MMNATREILKTMTLMLEETEYDRSFINDDSEIYEEYQPINLHKNVDNTDQDAESAAVERYQMAEIASGEEQNEYDDVLNGDEVIGDTSAEFAQGL